MNNSETGALTFKAARTAEQKVLALLGLARRSGKALTFGMDATAEGLRNGAVKLLVVACDCGGSTAKKVKRMAAQASCPCVRLADRCSLGASIGAREVSVLGIRDEGFAQGIRQILTQ